MTKRYLTPLIKIIVSTSLLYLLITRIGLDKILSQVHDVNFWYCAIATLALFLSNVLGSWQWHKLLAARGIHLSLGRTISYYFVGLFFNNFLIGYVGGDAIRIYDTSRVSGDSSGSVSAVFFDRFIGLLTMITMALISSIIWARTLGSGKIILTVIFIFIIWLAGLVVLFNKKLAKFIAHYLLKLMSASVRRKGSEIYNGINAFRNEKALLLRIALLSFGIQFLRIMVHYFAALAVGIHAHILYFLIFIPVVALASSLPISIGGIGVREQSAVFLFSRIGILNAEIVLFQFLAYLIGIVATIPGGLIFMIRKEHNRRASVPVSQSCGIHS